MAKNSWIFSVLFIVLFYYTFLIIFFNKILKLDGTWFTHLFWWAAFYLPILLVVIIVILYFHLWKGFNRIKDFDIYILSSFGSKLFGVLIYVGKLVRWLTTGRMLIIIRLGYIVLVFSFIRGLLILLLNQANYLLINKTTISNGSPKFGALTDGIYAINLTSGKVQLSSGLFLNMSSDKMFIGGDPSSPFSQISSLLISTFWYDWYKILLLWFIIESILFAWNSSRKLVIEEAIESSNTLNSDANAKKKPDKYNSPEDSEANDENISYPIKGLANLLMLYFDRINEPYHIVNEKNIIQSECGVGRPIKAEMKTEDIEGNLQTTLGTSGDLALGPVKIPTSSIAALIGA